MDRVYAGFVLVAAAVCVGVVVVGGKFANSDKLARACAVVYSCSVTAADSLLQARMSGCPFKVEVQP